MSEPQSDIQIESMKQWILKRNPKLSELDQDLDIIETRVIDSLQFVEFLLYVEELRGSEIPERQVTKQAFRTLRTIHNNFLSS